MSTNTQNSSAAAEIPQFAAWSIRIWSVVAAVVLAIAFAALLLHKSREEPPSIYRAVGYTDRVNELTRSNALFYQSSQELGEAANLHPWGRIEFDRSTARDYQKAFVGESGRLKRDLKAFNQSGSGIFNVSHSGKIEVDPYVHNFLLPYPERTGWRGSFSFGADAQPSLIGGGVALSFPKPGDKPNLRATSIEPIAYTKWFRPNDDVTTFRHALGYLLLGPYDGGIMRLQSGEKGIRLEVVDQQFTRIFLNGIIINRLASEAEQKELADRKKGLPPSTYQLVEGDRLRVVDKTGQQTVFRFVRSTGGLISQSLLENGRTITVIDEKLAAQLPYLQHLQDAVQTYARTHPNPGSLSAPNVQVTFDRDLQAVLQGKLEEYVRRFDRQRAALSDAEYEPAAIAVIDAFTGDVLAMPSYPGTKDIEEFEKRLQTGQAHGLSEGKLRRLTQNQNLAAVPIGSTSKPIFATAIWETHPALRTLKIQEPAGSIRTIFGYSFPRGGELHTSSSSRMLDPVTFLGKSSNTYMVSLYLLTLADPESYRMVGGSVQARNANGKLDFSQHLRGDLIPLGLNRENLPAHPKLAECFDIDLTADHIQGEAVYFDSGALQPLLDELDVEAGRVPPAFWKVSPRRTVLDLPRIDTVRGEMVSILIGGTTNRWSNLKLAEAYARIGSGRKVQMRLLKIGEDSKPTEEQIPVSGKVLDLVHEGMTFSVRDVWGTSHRLNHPLVRETARLQAKGLKLKAISKTGTARRVGPDRKTGRKERECAAVAFYVELQDASEKPLAAVATTIYLQDRAATRGGSSPRNSAVAVELGGQILPDLVAWLEKQTAVQDLLNR